MKSIFFIYQVIKSARTRLRLELTLYQWIAVHFWWVDSETQNVCIHILYYFKLDFVNNYNISSLACEYSSETGWLANIVGDLLGELEGLQCHSTTGTLSDSSKNMWPLSSVYWHTSYTTVQYMAITCIHVMSVLSAV